MSFCAPSPLVFIAFPCSATHVGESYCIEIPEKLAQAVAPDRICFKWGAKRPTDVEITDYH